jgi:hypothetical protein
MARKIKSELEEIHCECGGLLDRKGLLGTRPYSCVRCHRKYSQKEINDMWLEQFNKGGVRK